MRLLLFLFLLHASLVQCSSLFTGLDQSELADEIYNGFPDGSLLTLFFKWTPVDSSIDKYSSVVVELYENFTTRHGCLHFRISAVTESRVVSNIAKGDCRKGMSMPTQQDPKFWQNPKLVGDKWWRFDLLKINSTTFLPFFDGFNQQFRTHPEASAYKANSVHLRNNYLNMTAPIFDKDDAYMWYRLPNVITPKADRVLAAFDQATVFANPGAEPLFANIPGGFPVKTMKIKVAALMMSNLAKCKNVDDGVCTDKTDMSHNYAGILFMNSGIQLVVENKWDGAAKSVKIYLIARKDNTLQSKSLSTKTECNGGPNDHSSTDLVHFKLERPEKNTIKMRVYYMGSPAGVTCEVKVLDNALLAALDKPLTVNGYHSGTLLYLSVVDFAKKEELDEDLEDDEEPPKNP